MTLGDRDGEVADMAAEALARIAGPLWLPIPAILFPGARFAATPDDGFDLEKVPLEALAR